MNRFLVCFIGIPNPESTDENGMTSALPGPTSFGKALTPGNNVFKI